MHDDTSEWAVLPELKVSDAAAVEVLWHAAKRRHLRPFLGRSAGLADAAALLGIKKTAMSYWINRLLDVGLIRPRGIAQRGRHRLPQYRCIADRLRVALADAPLQSYEGVFDDTAARWQPQARDALARALARQGPSLELTIEAAGPGGLTTTLLPGAEPPSGTDDFVYYWGRLWLTAAERDRLREELDALWERYTALSDQARKPCATLLHLLGVPEPSRR